MVMKRKRAQPMGDCALIFPAKARGARGMEIGRLLFQCAMPHPVPLSIRVPAVRPLCKPAMLWRSSAPASGAQASMNVLADPRQRCVCGPKWAHEIKHDGLLVHLPERWRSSAGVLPRRIRLDRQGVPAIALCALTVVGALQASDTHGASSRSR